MARTRNHLKRKALGIHTMEPENPNGTSNWIKINGPSAPSTSSTVRQQESIPLRKKASEIRTTTQNEESPQASSKTRKVEEAMCSNDSESYSGRSEGNQIGLQQPLPEIGGDDIEEPEEMEGVIKPNSTLHVTPQQEGKKHPTKKKRVTLTEKFARLEERFDELEGSFKALKKYVIRHTKTCKSAKAWVRNNPKIFK